MTYDVDTLLRLIEPPTSICSMRGSRLSERDMLIVLALFRQFLPLRILEYGIGSGHASTFILEHCPFIVDYVGVSLKSDANEHRNRRMWPVVTDGTTGDFHTKLKNHVGDVQRYFDAIILSNGGSTEIDTEACLPFLRKGGLCLWHGSGLNIEVDNYLNLRSESGRRVLMPADKSHAGKDRASMAWEVV